MQRSLTLPPPVVGGLTGPEGAALESYLATKVYRGPGAQSVQLKPPTESSELINPHFANAHFFSDDSDSAVVWGDARNGAALGPSSSGLLDPLASPKGTTELPGQAYPEPLHFGERRTSVPLYPTQSKIGIHGSPFDLPGLKVPVPCKTHFCANCERTFHIAPSLMSPVCPLCRGELKSRNSYAVPPSTVIPFQLDEAEAGERLRAHLKGVKFPRRPGRRLRSRIPPLRKVFVPAVSFHGTVTSTVNVSAQYLAKSLDTASFNFDFKVSDNVHADLRLTAPLPRASGAAGPAEVAIPPYNDFMHLAQPVSWHQGTLSGLDGAVVAADFESEHTFSATLGQGLERAMADKVQVAGMDEAMERCKSTNVVVRSSRSRIVKMKHQRCCPVLVPMYVLDGYKGRPFFLSGLTGEPLQSWKGGFRKRWLLLGLPLLLLA